MNFDVKWRLNTLQCIHINKRLNPFHSKYVSKN